jgi:hypothetical protein
MSDLQINEIIKLLDDKKDEYNYNSLCHSEAGRWNSIVNECFEYATGVLSIFTGTGLFTEYAKTDDDINNIFTISGIISSLTILLLTVLKKIKTPSKNSEIHYQKSEIYARIKNMIQYEIISCETFEEHKKLYEKAKLEIDKLPMLNIPQWAKRKVDNNNNSKKTQKDMYQRRRHMNLDRCGIKYDKELYNKMEKLEKHELKEIIINTNKLLNNKDQNNNKNQNKDNNQNDNKDNNQNDNKDNNQNDNKDKNNESHKYNQNNNKNNNQNKDKEFILNNKDHNKNNKNKDKDSNNNSNNKDNNKNNDDGNNKDNEFILNNKDNEFILNNKDNEFILNNKDNNNDKNKDKDKEDNKSLSESSSKSLSDDYLETWDREELLDYVKLDNNIKKKDISFELRKMILHKKSLKSLKLKNKQITLKRKYSRSARF